MTTRGTWRARAWCSAGRDARRSARRRAAPGSRACSHASRGGARPGGPHRRSRHRPKGCQRAPSWRRGPPASSAARGASRAPRPRAWCTVPPRRAGRAPRVTSNETGASLVVSHGRVPRRTGSAHSSELPQRHMARAADSHVELPDAPRPAGPAAPVPPRRWPPRPVPAAMSSTSGGRPRRPHPPSSGAGWPPPACRSASPRPAAGRTLLRTARRPAAGPVHTTTPAPSPTQPVITTPARGSTPLAPPGRSHHHQRPRLGQRPAHRP